MKKLFLTLAIALSGCCSYAQTWSGATPGNIYYNSGKVGIGTNGLPSNGTLQINGPVDNVSVSANGAFRIYDGTSFAGGVGSDAWASAGNNLDFAVYAPNNLNIYGGGQKRISILSSGNVGIGTASPSALLDVESSTIAVTSLTKSGLNTGFSQFQAQNDNSENGAFHHAMFGSAYAGTMFGVSLANSATLYADGSNISGMLIGTKNATPITIGTNNAAAITILSGGNVGIGTTNPGSYKLAVNGGIHTQSVNVDLTGWPDFVFKNEYWLPSLTEVKTYIDRNHHLPDMPSEQEVIKDGINLGEMNKLLTKKVEELTLYLIEKDQENKELKQAMKAQQEDIALIKKQLETLIK